MYISHAPSDRDEYTRFQGLSDDAPDLQQLQKSLATIRAALELNPRTGYVKGSPPRKKLEEAFESVPRSTALELAQKLLEKEGPLERLFRYRLHTDTQRAMLLVLARKAEEFSQQQKEELRRMEEAQRRRRDLELELCAILKSQDSLTEELCRRMGEGSDQCRKFRSEALKTREQFRMTG